MELDTLVARIGHYLTYGCSVSIIVTQLVEIEGHDPGIVFLAYVTALNVS
jgi:hypothetical protein